MKIKNELEKYISFKNNLLKIFPKTGRGKGPEGYLLTE